MQDEATNQSLIGQSYAATLRPDGSVTASNADDLLTAVMGELGLSSDLAAPNLEVLKSQLGDQSIDNGLQQGLPALPGKMIRPGDSWKEDRTPGTPRP